MVFRHVPCFVREGDTLAKGHCEYHEGRCIEGRLRISTIAERAGVPADKLRYAQT